jgi:hypothetical protein
MVARPGWASRLFGAPACVSDLFEVEVPHVHMTIG